MRLYQRWCSTGAWGLGTRRGRGKEVHVRTTMKSAGNFLRLSVSTTTWLTLQTINNPRNINAMGELNWLLPATVSEASVPRTCNE